MPETHSFDFQTQLQTSKISSFPHATQSKQFSFDEHKFSDDFEDFNNKNKIKNNQKDANKKDENIDMIISGEVFDMDVFKSGQSNRHLNLFGDDKKKENDKISNRNKNSNSNINRNITDESEDLKDSYCDTLLKNIEQYRNANNNTNSFNATNKE